MGFSVKIMIYYCLLLFPEKGAVNGNNDCESSAVNSIKVFVQRVFSERKIKDTSTEIRLEAIEQQLNDIENVQKEILEKVKDIYEKLSPTEHNQDVPMPASRRISVQSVDQFTVRLDWEEPDTSNEVIQGYKIFYTSNPDLSILFWMNKEVTAEITTTTIGSLEPNTTYTITVAVSSSKGLEPLSEPVKVFTRKIDTAPILPPRNLRANAISPNVISVFWEPPEDADNNARYHYSLYFNDTGGFHYGHSFITEETSYNITDLPPDTNYVIQVAAKWSYAGLESPLSTAVQAKTFKFIPDAPERVQVKPINATTLYVEWRLPKVRKGSGIIRGYSVYYSPIDEGDEQISGEEKEADTYDGNKHELVVFGLLARARYKVSVAGYTRKGVGPHSRPVTVRME